VSDNLLYRYYYDADGKRRIKAKASDGQTHFQEDASYYFNEGESLACQLDIGELAPEEEEFYEPKFLVLDHLGSTRAEITFEGTGLTPTVSGSYDYMPYGQFINVPAEAPEQVCFTGKPRDPETGLDIFGPRGLNTNLCRWMSPDRLFADNQPGNLQSWNLYVYVGNNSLHFIDEAGYWKKDANGQLIAEQGKDVWRSHGGDDARSYGMREIKLTTNSGKKLMPMQSSNPWLEILNSRISKRKVRSRHWS